MTTSNAKIQKRNRRHRRIRATVRGTAERPRLSVYKSNKEVYAQLINDDLGTTLAAVTTKEVKGENSVVKALEAGKLIAKRAIEGKIKAVVFDRGGFVYTGKVKALAEGAREGGLAF